MKLHRALLVIVLISVGLTIAGPLWFDHSVSVYSDEFPGGNIHYPHWYLYGSWFSWYRQHPAWPEYGLPAEKQFLPLGFMLGVLLWSVIVGWIWLIAWLVASIFRDKLRESQDRVPKIPMTTNTRRKAVALVIVIAFGTFLCFALFRSQVGESSSVSTFSSENSGPR